MAAELQNTLKAKILDLDAPSEMRRACRSRRERRHGGKEKSFLRTYLEEHEIRK